MKNRVCFVQYSQCICVSCAYILTTIMCQNSFCDINDSGKKLNHFLNLLRSGEDLQEPAAAFNDRSDQIKQQQC